jgi:hypothetical protein
MKRRATQKREHKGYRSDEALRHLKAQGQRKEPGSLFVLSLQALRFFRTVRF